jgi:hypothetical protein
VRRYTKYIGKKCEGYAAIEGCMQRICIGQMLGLFEDVIASTAPILVKDTLHMTRAE